MKKTVSVIGGGPAAMLLAAQLNEQLFDVRVYEKNATLGRKFLVAGKGGFNLTHSEHPDDFVKRYTPASFLKNSLARFSNTDLQDWLASIGIQTYTGTSGRVFPVKGIKPVDVLNAVLNQLKNKQVKILNRYHWQGFNANNELVFHTPEGLLALQSDIVVFSLGGGSWKVTGSDGTWLNYFEDKGIQCLPFRASNCAFGIRWPVSFIEKTQGKALKNCCFTCGGKERKGEAVLTQFGIEGSGVYALSPEIRYELDQHQQATLFIDLKPQLSEADITQRLQQTRSGSLSKFLETHLKLSDTAVLLLKTYLSKEQFTQAALLAASIKKFPLQIRAMAPVDEAISTVGGIALGEIDQNFQLKKLPNHYAIGEMLDWDAPTGGYLLQACFSMGYTLAKHLNETGSNTNPLS